MRSCVHDAWIYVKLVFRSRMILRPPLQITQKNKKTPWPSAWTRARASRSPSSLSNRKKSILSYWLPLPRSAPSASPPTRSENARRFSWLLRIQGQRGWAGFGPDTQWMLRKEGGRGRKGISLTSSQHSCMDETFVNAHWTHQSASFLETWLRQMQCASQLRHHLNHPSFCR